MTGKDLDTDNYGQPAAGIRECLFDLSRSMFYGLTGDRLIWRMKKQSPKMISLVKGFLDKNLRLGLSKEQINKVLKKTGHQPIPIFRTSQGVPANVSYKKVWDKIKDSKHNWYASEELVGQRVLCHISPHHPPAIFYPNGKPLIAFPTLRDRLTDYTGKDGLILDTKVSLLTREGEDDFAGAESRLRSEDSTNAKLHVFDAYPIDTFIRGRGRPSFGARYERLLRAVIRMDRERVSVIGQYDVKSRSDWRDIVHRAKRDEWLGIVLRKDVSYEAGETQTIRVVDL